MFRLTRFFLLTGAVAAVIIVTMVAVLFWRGGISQLTKLAEAHNIALAQSFANTMWPSFSSYVASASVLDGEQIQNRPESRILRKVVNEALVGLPGLHVKIYDLKGYTIYSSEPGQINENIGDNRRCLPNDSCISFHLLQFRNREIAVQLRHAEQLCVNSILRYEWVVVAVVVKFKTAL